MRSSLLAPLVCAAVLTGCGSKKDGDRTPITGTPVAGKLVQGGAPIKFLKDETIKVTFYSEGAEKFSALGEVNKDSGEFKIDGPDGKGIPAGKYKIAIFSEIYGGDNTDRFYEKFDLKNTPFTAEVTAEPGQVFTVDITAKKVTKAK